MGRGRAKAKQQKVARELKYSTQQTDFGALQKELGASDPGYYRDSDSDSYDGDDEDDSDDGSYAHAR